MEFGGNSGRKKKKRIRSDNTSGFTGEPLNMVQDAVSVTSLREASAHLFRRIKTRRGRAITNAALIANWNTSHAPVVDNGIRVHGNHYQHVKPEAVNLYRLGDDDELEVMHVIPRSPIEIRGAGILRFKEKVPVHEPFTLYGVGVRYADGTVDMVVLAREGRIAFTLTDTIDFKAELRF